MTLILKSAKEHCFYEPESSFEIPEALPEDFPDRE